MSARKDLVKARYSGRCWWCGSPYLSGSRVAHAPVPLRYGHRWCWEKDRDLDAASGTERTG